MVDSGGHRNTNGDVEAPLLDNNKNKQRQRKQDTDLYDLVNDEDNDDEQSVGSFDNENDIEHYQPTKKYVNIKNYENVNDIPDQSTNPIDPSPYEDVTNEKAALIPGENDSIPHYEPKKRRQNKDTHEANPYQEVDRTPPYQPGVSENNYERLPDSPKSAPHYAPRQAPKNQPENMYEAVPNQRAEPVPSYEPRNENSSSNYDTVGRYSNQGPINNTADYEPVKKYRQRVPSSNHYDKIKEDARIDDQDEVVPQYNPKGRSPQGGFSDGIYDSVADQPDEPDHIKDLYAVVDKSGINKKK